MKLATIEAGRGVAALTVVLFHAGSAIFPAAKYWNAQVFGLPFGWAESGIFYFFVLSGFIIVHVHARDIGMPGRLRRYLMRRWRRIYPVYWVVLAGIVALGAAGVGAAGDGELASSVLLIGPDNRATRLAVAWTLYHEVAFYAVFASWIVSVRLGQAVTAAWLAMIAAGWLFGVAGVPAYLAAPVNLLFGFGVLAWRAARLALPGWLAVAGIVGFAAVAVDTSTTRWLDEPLRSLAYGGAAAVTIAALASVEARRAVAVPRLLTELGAASYSIYLTHFPLLSLFAKLAVAGGLVGRVPAEIGFVVTVAATVLAGWVFHRVVERPLLWRLGR